MAVVMEPFRNMDSTTTVNFLRNMMAENPQNFEGVTVIDLLLIIQDRQYIECAMDIQICSTPPRKHVWSLITCQDETCNKCLLPIDRGLICRKCSIRIHFYCYKNIQQCRLPYYRNYSRLFSHLFSESVTGGYCADCFGRISNNVTGKRCRFCGRTVHDRCLESSIDNRGYVLIQQFQQLLHPLLVIDLRVTLPEVAFRRFATSSFFHTIVIGGDRSANYVLRAFDSIRDELYQEPTFSFIPIGGMAEIGRSLGGRIRFLTKSAEYFIRQIPRFSTFNLCPWQVYENPMPHDEIQLHETFYHSFTLGMETYIDYDAPAPREERANFWTRIARATNPFRAFRQWRRRTPEYAPLEIDAPLISNHITLEIDGEVVDLTARRYLAIVLLNRIKREDDYPGVLTQPEINDDTFDVYGLTEYFKATRKNLLEKGIKLGQTNDVRIVVHEDTPFLSDGYSGRIKYTGGGVVREFHVRQMRPIKVLAAQGEYNREDRPLLPRGEREEEDGLLDANELYLDELEKRQRAPEMERERAWVLRRQAEREWQRRDMREKREQEEEEAKKALEEEAKKKEEKVKDLDVAMEATKTGEKQEVGRTTEKKKVKKEKKEIFV